MMQTSVDNSDLHRVMYMKALEIGVQNGDLSEYNAQMLRRSYDNHGKTQKNDGE